MTHMEFLSRIRARVHLVSLAAIALLSLLPATPAGAAGDVVPARVEGLNRVDTAAQVAALAFPSGAATAVIATSVAPQDALVGASVAGARDAAMLLTRPDEVSPETAAALTSLGVSDVILIGGFQAISQDVEAQLRTSFEVTRLFGETQYDTAQVVAQEVTNAVGLPRVDGLRTVLLSNGEQVPDALAGSPAAYLGPMPVLYTPSEDLAVESAEFLAANDVEQVVILGGRAAVSATVEGVLTAAGLQVQRLQGPTRVETATAVAAWTAEVFGLDETSLLVARGDEFPDALTAGQLGLPLILTATPDVVPATALEYVRARCETVRVVRAVGGTAAVTTAALEAVEDAGEACAAPGEQPPPGGDDALPTFQMTPLVALSPPGTIITTEVVAGADGGPLTTPLDVVLFPCLSVDVDGDGSAVFSDLDGDGFADGFGASDAGALIITGINNVNVEDTAVVVAAEPDDGRLGIQVSAGIEDCAAVVVVTGDGDGGLDVDATGRPTEDYGVALTSFTDDEPAPTAGT